MYKLHARGDTKCVRLAFCKHWCVFSPTWILSFGCFFVLAVRDFLPSTYTMSIIWWVSACESGSSTNFFPLLYSPSCILWVCGLCTVTPANLKIPWVVYAAMIPASSRPEIETQRSEPLLIFAHWLLAQFVSSSYSNYPVGWRDALPQLRWSPFLGNVTLKIAPCITTRTTWFATNLSSRCNDIWWKCAQCTRKFPISTSERETCI